MDTRSIVGAIIFGVPLAVVVFAVVRGIWRISRGEFEPEAGGSYGRQFSDDAARRPSDSHSEWVRRVSAVKAVPADCVDVRIPAAKPPLLSSN